MKTKILSIIILVAISLCGMAQNAERKTIIRKDNKGIIQSVEYANEDRSVSIPKSANEFFKTVLKVQAADRFDSVPHKSKRAEFIQEQFDQYYNGIKVEGAGYVFHYRNGEMNFAHGNYVKINNLNTQPALTAEDAKNAFTRYKEIPPELVTDYSSDLIIRVIPFQGDTLPMLLYKTTLFANHKNNNEIGYIDAQTGKVVLTESVFINYAATGTFATRYSGTQTGATCNYNGAYHLVDSTAGRAVIHTWNANNNTISINTTNLGSFRNELSDNDNNWTSAEHSANSNDMALDVHWALQQIRNRLFDVYKIKSFNDNNLTIEAFIRHGTGGDADNAGWNSTFNVLAFGAGNTNYLPLASVDVVAHEFGHGITQFQIGWGNGEYNEGMSDIWGAIMKYRIAPNQPTWLTGNQIQQGTNFNCTRNIQNTKDSKARTKMENTFGSSTYNSSTSGIYEKSGIFSHWFYLLVNGGSGVNDIGNSYQVYGVGMDNAENLIVEAVFNNYLRYTTNWTQIRDNLVTAARHLSNDQYGILAQQVENAWYAVGVGTKPTQISITGPTLICSGSSGTFTVSGYPAVFTWDKSSNLTLTGTGNSVSAAAKGNSTSYAVDWVGINLNGTVIAKKDVWVGAPAISSIEGPSSPPSNQTVRYTAKYNNLSAPASFEWVLNPVNSGCFIYKYGEYADVSLAAGSYQLLCRATNTCGTGNYYGISISTARGGSGSSSSFNVYPNPASDVLNIEPEEVGSQQSESAMAAAAAGTTGRNASNSQLDIRLYDLHGRLVLHKNTNAGKVQLNVSHLHNGNYYLHIYDGVSDMPEIHQIVVNH